MNRLRLMGSLFASAAFAALLSVAACDKKITSNPAPPVDDTQIAFSARLIKTLDATDLEKRLKAELRRRYERMHTGYLYWGFPMGGTPQGDVSIASSEPPTSTGDSGGGYTSTSHSGTNVQEKGVDEGDVVKTDGQSIYLARGTHFFVLKANPADETALVKDIDLKEYINELHLSGNLVSVITTSYYYPVADRAVAMPVYYQSGSPITRFYNYDVSTPSAPSLLATIDVPGSLRGSRRIGNTIYLVTDHTIDIPDPAHCWDYLDRYTSYVEACGKARVENLSKIEELTLGQLLPTRTATPYTEGVAGTPSTAPAVGYADVYIPEFGNGTGLALVYSIDLAGQAPAIASSAVLSSWGGIYMSQDSLYLTSDNYWLWIEPVQDADMPVSNPEPRTAVHKFSVAATGGKPLYRGSGMVDGWLNDRFSLGEYQGHLRIGTTRGGWWGEGRSNQLSVLAEENESLVSRGTITGLAPGESIYSMRYDRDRGYMVTFRQTDPLFTLDLSDPANPRVAGEIEVPGFSTYIHLLGTDRLLTIGQSGNNWGSGNKLQIFDVSDLTAPRLVDAYELGQGWSPARYDPHAFLYYELLGILTIPYTEYGTNANGYQYVSGLKVFNIDSSGITPRAGGIITSPTVTTSYGYSYNDRVDRSVIIGNNIYALAQRSVTVAGAGQLDIVKSVILPESYWYGPYVYGDTVAVSPPPPTVAVTDPGTATDPGTTPKPQ